MTAAVGISAEGGEFTEIVKKMSKIMKKKQNQKNHSLNLNSNDKTN